MNWKDLAPLVGLLALVLFFSLVTPDFFRLATLTAVLKQGSVLAIATAGLTFVLLCGEIDLSVGFVALWVASGCGWLLKTFGSVTATSVNEPAMMLGETSMGLVLLSLIVPLVVSLGIGTLSGCLTIWSRLPSFIITLAVMFIALGASRYMTQSETLAVPDLLKSLGNDGFQLSSRLTVPYSALLATGLYVLSFIVLKYTRFGRYVYMTGGNREAARLAGVRTGQIVVGCLAISAFTAGLAGLVNAGRLYGISQDQNQDLLLSAVACVVLGGTSLFGGEGGIGRTVIGVLTFTVLRVGLNGIETINDLARDMFMGVVLLCALVLNGLLARKR